MLARIKETPAMAGDVLREASRIGNKVTDAVRDGARAANQQIRRGRHAAEEMVDDAKSGVRRRPLTAVAVVFAAGFLSGGIVARAARRRR
jgi:ElaB/YqjD/DUF883 family membrane-anchored ribosome-binding protein